jgi:DNA-binding Lrp family transcriptional regulator
MAAKSSGGGARKQRSSVNLDEGRPLDRIDRQLLNRLQQDGRISISDLASEVHLSVSPCLARVRRLERLGYIMGYVAQIDPQRVGLSMLAYIAVPTRSSDSTK